MVWMILPLHCFCEQHAVFSWSRYDLDEIPGFLPKVIMLGCYSGGGWESSLQVLSELKFGFDWQLLVVFWCFQFNVLWFFGQDVMHMIFLKQKHCKLDLKDLIQWTLLGVRGVSDFSYHSTYRVHNLQWGRDRLWFQTFALTTLWLGVLGVEDVWSAFDVYCKYIYSSNPKKMEQCFQIPGWCRFSLPHVFQGSDVSICAGVAINMYEDCHMLIDFKCIQQQAGNHWLGPTSAMACSFEPT